MNHSSSRRRTRPFALWRMCICASMVMFIACAGSAQTLEVLPPTFAPSVETSVSTAGTYTGDNGYWFVSTHSSPQSFDHTCPRFCPGVLLYEHCHGYHASSFEQLCQSIEPGVPVCIMIHGSFVDSPSAFRESVYTWNWIRNAGMGHRMQMIYVTWPSDRPCYSPTIQIDVNLLGRRAARNGYYIAELLQHLPPDCPVCLLGHSHGTRVIASCLHLLAGGQIQGVAHPFARVNGRRIRTVFMGSAIDHDWLNPNQRYGRALCSTECLLNYKNHLDPALGLYPLRLPLFTKRALGSIGLTAGDRRALGPWSSKVVEFDVTRSIGVSHLWPNYFRQPGLATLMHNYVYFPDVNPAMQVSMQPSESITVLPTTASQDGFN